MSERYINNLTGDFSICFSEHLTEHPSKMPRGDKDQIMRYELPTFTSAEEENIGNMMVDIMSKINVNRQINDNLPLLDHLIFLSVAA